MKSREIHFLFQLDGGTMHILMLQLLGSFEPSQNQSEAPQRWVINYWDIIPGLLYFPAPIYNS